MLYNFGIRVSAELIEQVKKLSFAAIPVDFYDLIRFKNLQRVAASIITRAIWRLYP